MSIAGSDPSGGAGVQRDLLTFAAFGVHGYSALTAVIAQSSTTVKKQRAVSPAMVSAQIEAVIAERVPDAMKTGVLANAAVVRAVARAIGEWKLPAPVVDPVMISSAGVRLLDVAGERALMRELIPLARVVTPNIPEAETLAQIRIDSDASLREAARAIIALGAAAVVIKGGHRARSGDSLDLL
ncbi:MAG TPA: hydroxymethylpyrimidine/phosphomethylpyrimidine kinase, partial [Candidatus Binataceae bacterium]|nr:hydroxymethylpyrimidine/phosphomethylpyrimidine kinase [Candidatus Binataceae bacterium]